MSAGWKGFLKFGEPDGQRQTSGLGMSAETADKIVCATTEVSADSKLTFAYYSLSKHVKSRENTFSLQATRITLWAFEC